MRFKNQHELIDAILRGVLVWTGIGFVSIAVNTWLG